MQIRNDSFIRSWPTYSSSVCGRSVASSPRSSSVTWLVMIRSGTGLPPNGSNHPHRSSLVLLRRRQHLRRWRDRALPRSRHLASAVRRTEDTTPVQVRQSAFKLLELALAHAATIYAATASRHIGAPDLHIALGTGATDRQEVHAAEGHALDQGRVSFFTDLRRGGYTGRGVAGRTGSTGHPDALRRLGGVGQEYRLRESTQ